MQNNAIHQNLPRHILAMIFFRSNKENSNKMNLEFFEKLLPESIQMKLVVYMAIVSIY
jgi:hypothetical protein